MRALWHRFTSWLTWQRACRSGVGIGCAGCGMYHASWQRECRDPGNQVDWPGRTAFKPGNFRR